MLYDNMKTVVIERNAYGRGRHRFHAAFRDFAGHHGFRPRLCRPYRAETEGKVERFIRYPRASFWVPFASRLAQEGLVADRDAANAPVSRWLHEVLSMLFNLTEVWGLRPDGSSPCRHVKKYPESKRERYLSPDELARLGAALDRAERNGAETASAIAAFRLLILTGCRMGEIQTLKWEHVQSDVLALPDSKTGAKKVYLGAAAREVLRKIVRLPDNEYVITGKMPGQHLTDLERPWRRLRARADLGDVRIHDLRTRLRPARSA